MFEPRIPTFVREPGRYVFRESLVARVFKGKVFPLRDVVAILMKVFGFRKDGHVLVPQRYSVSIVGLMRALAVVRSVNPEMWDMIMTLARLLEYTPSDYLMIKDRVDYADVMKSEAVSERWSRAERLFPRVSRDSYREVVEEFCEEVFGQRDTDERYKEYRRLELPPPISRRRAVIEGETPLFLALVKEEVAKMEKDYRIDPEAFAVLGREILVDEELVPEELRGEVRRRLEELVKRVAKMEIRASGESGK